MGSTDRATTPPEDDVFTTISRLAAVDEAKALVAYRDAMRAAYWEHQDLHAAIAIACAGTGRLLADAHRAEPTTAYETRSAAKAVLYDLASFAWPGWDEPGIEISPSDAAMGLAAARMNLVLAVELDKGDLPGSRAHWMIGAYLLTAGDPRAAKAEFEAAVAQAQAADAEPEADLAEAFAGLADLADTGEPNRLESALERLGAHDGGAGFADQVMTARRVLDIRRDAASTVWAESDTQATPRRRPPRSEVTMAATASTMLPLGTSAPAFSLRDATTGGTVSLAGFDDKPVVLVMFISNHCPYVKHVAAELGRIGSEYGPQGVAVVAIGSNDVANYPDDAPARMVEFAAANGFTFPYVQDETQEVALAYRAACTPDFFVFDTDRKLVYRGQLDGARPSNDVPVDGRDLRAALDAALDGKPSPEPQLPSMGCNIKWKAGNAPDYFPRG